MCLERNPMGPLLAPFKPLGWIAALGEALTGAACRPQFNAVIEAVEKWRETFWRGEADFPDAPEAEYPSLYAKTAVEKAAEAAVKAGMLAVYTVDYANAFAFMAAFRGPPGAVEVRPPTTGTYAKTLVELGLAKPIAVLPIEEARELARRRGHAVVVEIEKGQGAVFKLPLF